MVERRALIEGLKEIDENINPDLAEAFVYPDKPRSRTPKSTAASKAAAPPAIEEPPAAPPHAVPATVVATAQVTQSSPLTGVGRVPVGARVRTELAAALKRASLERQLNGIQPNSVQEILEGSLELWLLKHGHLK
jgi:hypothetical protein